MTKTTIPRPLNCFLMYRLEKQKEIVAKCAGANHRDISKIIAKWWQEATEEEKKPFRERARIAKQEHRKLYPDYKYTPKKKATPKRVYIRRNKKDQFTSRAQENNKLMEMIYENPTVLESIVKEENQSTDTVSTKDKTTKKPICYSNIKLEDYPHYSYRPSCQFEDYYHLTFYQVPSQMSPMSTFSETPQVSPYIDCYSEYDMASPDIETTTSETRYFQPAAEARSVSPFSLLDVPYINDFNAYGYQETGLADNSYLMDSITKNNDNTKPTLDFGSMTDDVSFLFDQPQQQQFNDNDFLMQFNQSIQYINPALLHI